MMLDIPCTDLPAAMVQQDAYRPFDWRWQRAQHWSKRTDRRGWNDEDFWTREAAIASRERPWWFRPSQAFAARLERVEVAHRLHCADSTQTVLQKARILAGMSTDDIADRLHASVDAVQWHERLFFDVRNRLDCEAAIVLSVLGRQPLAGRKRVAWALQWIGYFGGEVVLDAATPLLLPRLSGHSTEDIPADPALRDCIETLLADEHVDFTAEYWAAVRPLFLDSHTVSPDQQDWCADLCDKLVAGLAKSKQQPQRVGHTRFA